MAQFTIVLEREDIFTNRNGNNFLIKARGIDVIFTPEAMEELLSDFQKFKQDVKVEVASINGDDIMLLSKKHTPPPVVIINTSQE